MKFHQYLILTLKGCAMGMADVVPGVSGGTIAFISGIYEELIDSIKSINMQALKLLFTFRLAEFWRHINGRFLCAVLLGIFLIEVAVTRIVSLGSIIIAALYPVGTLINLIARGANAATIVFSTVCCVIMAAMVIWLHRSNIERLKNGTEYRFGQKK